MVGLQRRARIIVGTATFFDGFDALSIAQVMPTLTSEWHLSAGNVGFLISSGFFGQCIGAFCLPWLAERLGRLRIITYSVAVFGLTSILCGFSPSFEWLAALRFIQGIGLGGEVSSAVAYINEIARSHRRGRFFVLYESLFGVGLLVAGVAGSFIVPNLGWQWLFFVGGVPALLAFALRRSLPESPRWLAQKGRHAEADAIVTAMERDAEARTDAPLPAADPGNVPPPLFHETRWREVFSPLYRRRTLVIWSVWFCAFFVSQGVNSWLPSLFRTVLHTDVRSALQYSYTATAFSMVGFVITAFVVDPLGRKWFIALALPLGGLPLLVLSFVGVPSEAWLLACVSLSYMCTGSVSIVLYLWTPELYPTRMRAMGTGFGGTWRNVATTISPLLIGHVLGAYGIAPVFLMLGLVPFVAAAIVLAFGTETAGRVLEEVSR